VVQTVSAVVVLLALVLVGLDPLVGVFGSMAGVSTVGMVLLMTVTSIAALAFFSRHPALVRGHVLQTRVAPAVAVLGLLACAWLVLSNFTLVTGGSAGVSTVLALVPVVAFVVGFLLGGRYALQESTE
jgi:L-asparagine transporter-like permease